MREKLDDYTLELQRHGLESVEREVRWLNELIQGERTGAGPAHATQPSTTESQATPKVAARKIPPVSGTSN